MKVMITGGTGFLGSRLALRQVEAGNEVCVVAREATELEAANSRDLQAAGVDVRVGDVCDGTAIRGALQGAQRVYHIAAAMREANVPDDHFWEVNVRATERLLELSRETGVERFVYCSTAGVVGTDRGVQTDEESEPRPKDIYQVTKLAAERAVLEFSRQHGYPASAVRPPAVYGPGDGRLLKLFRMVGKGRFLMPGGGKGKHHLVFIDDLLDGMELAATRDEAIGKTFNVAGERAVPLEELVGEIARALEVECRLVRIPFAPLEWVAWGCETVCRPLGVQPPIYRRRLDFFRHDEDFSIRRAREELGYQPQTPLAPGLARTIEAYRAQGLLT